MSKKIERHFEIRWNSTERVWRLYEGSKIVFYNPVRMPKKKLVKEATIFIKYLGSKPHVATLTIYSQNMSAKKQRRWEKK